MKSKNYHDLLLNEYEKRELSTENLSSTLNNYAELYFREKEQKMRIDQDFKSRISLLEYFITYYEIIDIDYLKQHRENIIKKHLIFCGV
jgi:hypothetical protein